MEWAAENTGENIRNAKFFSQKALIEILPVSYAEACPEFGAMETKKKSGNPPIC